MKQLNEERQQKLLEKASILLDEIEAEIDKMITIRMSMETKKAA